MSYRDKASFGKRHEYLVIAELLRRGFDVFVTLVDDQGIDCIVRLDNRRYLDIQIKARSEQAKQSNLFAAMTVSPRANFYFIFYSEKDSNYWIIPSCELAALCSVNKTGKNKGTMSLSICKIQKLDKYKNDNGFELLWKFDLAPQEISLTSA